MANTKINGNDVTTVGELPPVGTRPPAFTLAGTDLAEVSLDQFEGKRVVLNIFPNIATGVCAASVRTFNQRAAGLDNAVVLCVSNNTPSELGGFCAAEGIENVVSASALGTSFGDDYGVTMTDGAMEALLARSVVVVNERGEIVHTQLVPEITTEPDYDKALSALD